MQDSSACAISMSRGGEKSQVNFEKYFVLYKTGGKRYNKNRYLDEKKLIQMCEKTCKILWYY